jgi:hypothetical protein
MPKRAHLGPLALSKVHWVRPSLNGMQNAVGLENFESAAQCSYALFASRCAIARAKTSLAVVLPASRPPP